MFCRLANNVYKRRQSFDSVVDLRLFWMEAVVHKFLALLLLVVVPLPAIAGDGWIDKGQPRPRPVQPERQVSTPL
jgi:hypothetical protein